MKHAIWIGLLALGCSGGDTCVDAYADGSGSLYSGTSCPEKTAPSEVTDLPDATGGETCTETFAYQCRDASDPSTCGEVYEKECPSGLVEKTLEPNCRITTTTGDYPHVAVPAFSVRSSVGNLTDPWKRALERFNTLLAGGNPALRFVQKGAEVSLRPPQIRDFQIVTKGGHTNPSYKDASGLTICSDNDTFGRHNCQVWMFLDAIRGDIARTGSTFQDMANAVALHEIGHVACIQHQSQDPAIPTPNPVFTAMNNFVLDDTINKAAVYFTLDPTEVENAREAWRLGRKPPSKSQVSRQTTTD